LRLSFNNEMPRILRTDSLFRLFRVLFNK